MLEFNSTRKRMSVIVKKLIEDDEKPKILLLTKGADNVIFERLATGNEALKRETEKHLGEFAGDGLRTLTLAYRIVPGSFHNAFSLSRHDKLIAISSRRGVPTMV